MATRPRCCRPVGAGRHCGGALPWLLGGVAHAVYDRDGAPGDVVAAICTECVPAAAWRGGDVRLLPLALLPEARRADVILQAWGDAVETCLRRCGLLGDEEEEEEEGGGGVKANEAATLAARCRDLGAVYFPLVAAACAVVECRAQAERAQEEVALAWLEAGAAAAPAPAPHPSDGALPPPSPVGAALPVDVEGGGSCPPELPPLTELPEEPAAAAAAAPAGPLRHPDGVPVDLSTRADLPCLTVAELLAFEGWGGFFGAAAPPPRAGAARAKPPPNQKWTVDRPCEQAACVSEECVYCHSRVELEFHPRRYKTVWCDRDHFGQRDGGCVDGRRSLEYYRFDNASMESPRAEVVVVPDGPEALRTGRFLQFTCPRWHAPWEQAAYEEWRREWGGRCWGHRGRSVSKDATKSYEWWCKCIRHGGGGAAAAAQHPPDHSSRVLAQAWQRRGPQGPALQHLRWLWEQHVVPTAATLAWAGGMDMATARRALVLATHPAEDGRAPVAVYRLGGRGGPGAHLFVPRAAVAAAEGAAARRGKHKQKKQKQLARADAGPCPVDLTYHFHPAAHRRAVLDADPFRGLLESVLRAVLSGAITPSLAAAEGLTLTFEGAGAAAFSPEGLPPLVARHRMAALSLCADLAERLVGAPMARPHKERREGAGEGGGESDGDAASEEEEARPAAADRDDAGGGKEEGAGRPNPLGALSPETAAAVAEYAAVLFAKHPPEAAASLRTKLRVRAQLELVLQAAASAKRATLRRRGKVPRGFSLDDLRVSVFGSSIQGLADNAADADLSVALRDARRGAAGQEALLSQGLLRVLPSKADEVHWLDTLFRGYFVKLGSVNWAHADRESPWFQHPPTSDGAPEADTGAPLANRLQCITDARVPILKYDPAPHVRRNAADAAGARDARTLVVVKPVEEAGDEGEWGDDGGWYRGEEEEVEEAEEEEEEEVEAEPVDVAAADPCEPLTAAALHAALVESEVGGLACDTVEVEEDDEGFYVTLPSEEAALAVLLDMTRAWKDPRRSAVLRRFNAPFEVTFAGVWRKSWLLPTLFHHDFDLSLRFTGPRGSNFIRAAVAQNPAWHAFLYVVKFWAKDKGLIKAEDAAGGQGGKPAPPLLSSYAVVVMAIDFLSRYCAAAGLPWSYVDPYEVAFPSQHEGVEKLAAFGEADRAADTAAALVAFWEHYADGFPYDAGAVVFPSPRAQKAQWQKAAPRFDCEAGEAVRAKRREAAWVYIGKTEWEWSDEGAMASLGKGRAWSTAFMLSDPMERKTNLARFLTPSRLLRLREVCRETAAAARGGRALAAAAAFHEIDLRRTTTAPLHPYYAAEVTAADARHGQVHACAMELADYLLAPRAHGGAALFQVVKAAPGSPVGFLAHDEAAVRRCLLGGGHSGPEVEAPAAAAEPLLYIGTDVALPGTLAAEAEAEAEAAQEELALPDAAPPSPAEAPPEGGGAAAPAAARRLPDRVRWDLATHFATRPGALEQALRRLEGAGDGGELPQAPDPTADLAALAALYPTVGTDAVRDVYVGCGGRREDAAAGLERIAPLGGAAPGAVIEGDLLPAVPADLAGVPGWLAGDVLRAGGGAAALRRLRDGMHEAPPPCRAPHDDAAAAIRQAGAAGRSIADEVLAGAGGDAAAAARLLRRPPPPAAAGYAPCDMPAAVAPDVAADVLRYCGGDGAAARAMLAALV